jgi:beta-barrel assembly-enhancing protease
MKSKLIRNLVLLVILGVIGFSLYGCDALKDITNKIDTNDIGEVVNLAADVKKALRSDFTEEERYYIGRSTCAYVLGKYPLVEDSVLTAYVNKVGTTCALASNKPTTFKGYRFIIFDDDNPNAYGTPGGMILISKGMLELCETEDELAAVLAHEVEHVVKDHPMKAISSATKKEALINVAKYVAFKTSEEATDKIPSDLLKGLTESFGKVLGDIMNALDNGYERKTEYEADSGAVQTLQTAGYNVDSLKSVIEKLPHNNKKYGGNHPKPDDRVKAIDKRIGELSISPHSILSSRTTRFTSAMSSGGIN